MRINTQLDNLTPNTPADKKYENSKATSESTRFLNFLFILWPLVYALVASTVEEAQENGRTIPPLFEYIINISSITFTILFPYVIFIFIVRILKQKMDVGLPFENVNWIFIFSFLGIGFGLIWLFQRYYPIIILWLLP